MSAPTDIVSENELRLTEDEYRSLSGILWEYRAGLHRVEFLLEAQLQFSRSGGTDHLSVIADVLAETASGLGQLDLRRELLLGGSSESASLGKLARAADEPWQSMLVEHHDSLLGSTTSIAQLADRGRRAMGTTLALLEQLLGQESEAGPGTYDRQGRNQRNSVPSVLFDSHA